MKKKIVWLVVSCLMVLSLVMASCAPAVTEEEGVVTEEEGVVTEEEGVVEGYVPPAEWGVKEGVVIQDPLVPKYGGVARFVNDRVDLFDMFTSYTAYSTQSQTHDYLTMGDWSKGPAGTGEIPYQDVIESGWFPEQVLPALAESWEIPDAETTILHIRQGVHFALDPKSEASRLVNGRELTAEDVAFSLEWYSTGNRYAAPSVSKYLESITATDKYTVVIKGHEVGTQTLGTTLRLLLPRPVIVPKEVLQKYGNLSDWRVAVGTGPFILVDYVEGSVATLERNPNHWMNDPLHPENQLPYLDGMKFLIIPDASTRLAALRTGKIDWIGRPLATLTMDDAELLWKSNPQLQWNRTVANKETKIYMRTDLPPYNDIRVRQALQMAIDYDAIARDYWRGEAAVIGDPIAPAYQKVFGITREELPESTRELYSYNPEKARQLLAEAGYPDGFKAEVILSIIEVDELSIVKDYWEAISVELNFVVKEVNVINTIMNTVPKSYQEMFASNSSVFGIPSPSYWDPQSASNSSLINDPYLNERIPLIVGFESMFNQAVRHQAVVESHLRMLAMTWEISLPRPYTYTAWWPWLQNYHGEYQVGHSGRWAWNRFLWYDPALKKAMGY